MVKRLLQSGLIAALLFLNPIFAQNLAENSVNLNQNSTKNSQNSAEFNPTQNLATEFSDKKFILINEGILKPEAAARLDEIGTELKLKSGISLALGVSHQSLDELLNLAQSLNEPYLLFVMSLKDKKIKVQSVGIFAPNEAEKIAQKVLESSVYPLLGQKNPNYAAALFNGYADFADTIATHENIALATSVGNANRQTMNIIKIVFYGVICVALLYFFSRRTKRKKI